MAFYLFLMYFAYWQYDLNKFNSGYYQKNLNFIFNNNEQVNLLDDIVITLKTTFTNHKTRLKWIASTWYKLAHNQVEIWLPYFNFFILNNFNTHKKVYVITDKFDLETNYLYGNWIKLKYV